MKRALDILLASFGFILAFPFMVAVALAIRVFEGSPVLFRQERMGHREKPFMLLKFRTMREVRDSSGNYLSDVRRVTQLGRFLRKTSLDELPQLWNVIKGDMSLVGPRPLYVHYLPYYNKRERKRHLVRPGITGLAQISGRNRLTWDERLEIDVQYVGKQRFALDLYIIWKTIGKVIRRKDVLVIPDKVQGTLIQYRKKKKYEKEKEEVSIYGFDKSEKTRVRRSSHKS